MIKTTEDYDRIVDYVSGDEGAGPLLVTLSQTIIDLAEKLYEGEGEEDSEAVVLMLGDMLHILTSVAHLCGITLGDLVAFEIRNFEAIQNELQNIWDALEVAEEVNKKDLH